jgi:molecular chaperone DnaK (HSP70)
LKNLLGKSFDSEIAADYRSTFTNQMVPDTIRNTCSFSENATSSFSIEELVGFQLAHAKKQAELFGGEAVSGAVLTVNIKVFYNCLDTTQF